MMMSSNAKEAAPLPVFPGEEELEQVRKMPVPFRKLHRRSGDRFGLYLAETRSRFVVSDGQREVLGMFSVLILLVVILIMLCIGRAFDIWELFVVSGILSLGIWVSVFFMTRQTTTLDRRIRRMVVETIRFGCFRKRIEYDLDDVIKVSKKGLGRQAQIVVELSGGEEVYLTKPALFAVDDLKTVGPNRINNFLRRVRGLAKRPWPPTYVLARGKFSGSAEREELSFEVGDVVKVLEFDESGWWKGKLASGALGMFPANFTVEMAPSELYVPPPPPQPPQPPSEVPTNE